MLLFAFVGAAIAIFIAALVWLGVRFIGEALVPAALIAAIGFLLSSLKLSSVKSPGGTHRRQSVAESTGDRGSRGTRNYQGYDGFNDPPD